MSSLLLMGSEYLLSYVGQALLSKGLHKTGKLCYQKLSKLLEFGHREINLVIQESDIYNLIRTVELTITSIQQQEKKSSISYLISSIQETVQTIEFLIMELQIILAKHKQKYFSKYRKPKYHKELQRLQSQIKLLQTRFNLLVKIIDIQQVTNTISILSKSQQVVQQSSTKSSSGKSSSNYVLV